ncbi:Ger(x)C family spore germination protein [Paenibacillus alvei]|uniref:Ger(x)C family spore germination protein n=1 Tax=Paenibacillus alvei TaxID=44250 RepID=UPI0013D92560|nr:Ger(x)C family spore germination protein [Paenibacillus alvei]NEZ41266.1 Ger(x)C family spore germination protein [Paenibacillus alvei]
MSLFYHKGERSLHNTRKQRLWLLISILSLVLPLAGCWDITNIQDMNYVTALGIDYVNGKYIVYTNSLEFTNVAKQEGTRSPSKPPTWIGKGEGYTLDSAVNDIYAASTLQIIWDHTTVLIFSERALQKDVNKMIDSLLRFSGIRYTPWVYGTKTPIADLFAVSPPFNLSPIASMLYAPDEILKQQTNIPPLQLLKMVALLNEPGCTVLLPSLSLNNEEWMKDKKTISQHELNGVFVLQNGKYKNWVKQEEGLGLRWLSNQIHNVHIGVGRPTSPDAILTINKHKVSVNVSLHGEVPKFNLVIDVRGSVEEIADNATEEAIIAAAKEKIKNDVQQTFQQGLNRNLDIYSLKNHVYRKYLSIWKKNKNGSLLQLTPNSLERIDVRVQIEHSGMIRLNR